MILEDFSQGYNCDFIIILNVFLNWFNNYILKDPEFIEARK